MRPIPHMKTVMTPFPHAVDSMEDMAVARAMMQQHGIRHLPVIHEGTLGGMLSERDLQLASGIVAFRDPPMQLPVWAVCSREPFVVDLEMPVDEVVEEMASRHLGSAIVTRKGKVVGIFTTTDACRLLAKRMREDAGTNQDDDVA